MPIYLPIALLIIHIGFLCYSPMFLSHLVEGTPYVVYLLKGLSYKTVFMVKSLWLSPKPGPKPSRQIQLQKVRTSISAIKESFGFDICLTLVTNKYEFVILSLHLISGKLGTSLNSVALLVTISLLPLNYLRYYISQYIPFYFCHLPVYHQWKF